MIAKNQNAVMGICENGIVKFCKLIIPSEIIIPPEPTDVHYLTFKSDTAFSLNVATPKWDGTLYTSQNAQDWTQWDGSEVASSADGYLYMRGSNNTVVGGNNSANSFIFVGASNLECNGNIEYLLDWETVSNGEHPTMGNYSFYYLFRGNTSLIKPPEMPIINLTTACYRCMFMGTGLKTVPELPATIIPANCYNSMFANCSDLKISETQTGNYTKPWRIPTEGTTTSIGTNWNTSIISKSGGSYTGAIKKETTYYVWED